MPALLTALLCYVVPGLVGLAGSRHLINPEGVWKRARLDTQTAGLTSEAEPTAEALDALRRRGLRLLAITVIFASASHLVLAGHR